MTTPFSGSRRRTVSSPPAEAPTPRRRATPTPAPPPPPRDIEEDRPETDASVGELFSKVTSDISTLMRQEFALAKAELKQEASKAGKAAGLLVGAGFVGYLLAVFASLTLMFLIDIVVPLWAAAAIMTALFGIVAFVLFTMGRKKLKTVDPTPHLTIETLKEGVPK